MTRFLLILVLLVSGCQSRTDDRQAFYTSVLIQEAWFARQAEPAPDAWRDFHAALQAIPEKYRETAHRRALEELENAIPHDLQN